MDGSNVIGWRSVPNAADNEARQGASPAPAAGANVTGWRSIPGSEAYYMLLADADLVVGQHVCSYDGDDEPIQVVTDPRTLTLSEVEERYDVEDKADIVLNQVPGPLRLVRVVPQGAVRPWVSSREGGDGEPVVFDHPTDLICEMGWSVAELLPISAVLGPQAGQLVAAVREAERVLVNYEDEAAVNAYIGAYNPQHEQAERHAEAAEAALNAINADGWWWRQLGACAYGHEVLALVARDLIGTTPEWTQDAYNVLTSPWRAAFGRPVHPDDATCLPVAVPQRYTEISVRPLGRTNREGNPQ